MINRYSGEIHINPISQLRNGDFNNNGQIKNIDELLIQAIELNHQISARLQQIKTWLDRKNFSGSTQFNFADGGYISINGLPDSQLEELASRGLIELYDFATDKNWVKKFGQHFGLIWENGQALKI